MVISCQAYRRPPKRKLKRKYEIGCIRMRQYAVAPKVLWIVKVISPNTLSTYFILDPMVSCTLSSVIPISPTSRIRVSEPTTGFALYPITLLKPLVL